MRSNHWNSHWQATCGKAVTCSMGEKSSAPIVYCCHHHYKVLILARSYSMLETIETIIYKSLARSLKRTWCLLPSGSLRQLQNPLDYLDTNVFLSKCTAVLFRKNISKHYLHSSDLPTFSVYFRVWEEAPLKSFMIYQHHLLFTNHAEINEKVYWYTRTITCGSCV